MASFGTKRKSDHDTNAPHKAPKLHGSNSASTGGKAGKMSFAQRMMAKMGYVEGQGLGRDGEGIVNPIEVKLRPQGAGVGTVKEKTQQAKDEERRRAEMRGEEYEDSSEEERKRRKERRKQGAGRTGSGANGQASARPKKAKYRTVADIQAVAPGLDVPQTMLGSILDATGTDRKLLTSTAGLMAPVIEARDEQQLEREKIDKRERLELEAFIDAWHGLQEQKIYHEEHEGQHSLEIGQITDDISVLKELLSAVETLQLSTRPQTDPHDAWSALISQLRNMQSSHNDHVNRHELHEASIAALQAAFKLQLEGWDIEAEPSYLVNDLTEIGSILGRKDEHLIDSVVRLADADSVSAGQTKATTVYETLVSTIWMPRVRRFVQTWDVLHFQPVLDMVQAWTPLLPPFVKTALLDNNIVPRLTAALQEWDPRPHRHHHKRSSVKSARPSEWLFPWLPLLPPYQLDAQETGSLMSEVRRKLQQVLSSWSVSAGVVPSIADFRELLGSDFEHLLVKHLLPRLSLHLSREFSVDPVDQDLTPFERILDWQPYFSPHVLARLLAAEFFPKWILVLHEWLVTPDASFDEIGQWLQWWKAQIPAPIAQCEDVIRGWQKGTDMINKALDILDAGGSLAALPGPAVGPAKPLSKTTPAASSDANIREQQLKEATVVDFRDELEAWCAEEDLSIIPLREAHPGTGLPLLRITASASGKGGVIVYVKGDVVWAQKKNDRTTFHPIELGEGLIQRAEGK